MANIWSGKLSTDVQFGHVLVIGGQIKPQPIKLSIDYANNRLTGSEYTSNDHITLHLSARFNERQIIRSSHFPSIGWSDEQISDNLIGKVLKNPLKPGQSFMIRLTVLQTIFQIHVNDELYCTYDHSRWPLNEIRYINVKYDFERITIFDHRQLFPDIFPIQRPSESVHNLDVDEILVFQSNVPKPLAVDGTGVVIIVYGLLAGRWDSQFFIDLLNNGSDRILFRLNVRFDKKMVVRTGQRSDLKFYDEDEERFGEFPFKRGKSFKISIATTSDALHVSINDHLFTYFNHRTIPNELSTIKCSVSYGTHLTITGIEYRN